MHGPSASLSREYHADFFDIQPSSSAYVFSEVNSLDSSKQQLGCLMPLVMGEIAQTNLLFDEGKESSAEFSFSRRWSLLGPFRIGTREAVWGADPLEAIGGFHSLRFDHQATFASSLAVDARVSWSSVIADGAHSTSAATLQLDVDFPKIDWSFARSIYGWAALQYQAWARGSIFNSGHVSRKVELYTDQILELWVNDQHFFGGDFYAFRRAPIVITLLPGENVLEVRLVRDVRVMGGALPPTISVSLEARLSDELLRISEAVICPDLIDGRLASQYFSVIARNMGEEWISVTRCASIKGADGCRLLTSSPIRIAPGQSKPVGIIVDGETVASVVHLTLAYLSPEEDETRQHHVSVCFELQKRRTTEPHKVTFLHPSGAVSYFILQAPHGSAISLREGKSLPILLNLHGAGLEADSYQVRHQLDSVSTLNAWTLFPTGMSPWSGDDWHSWALLDVKAAVAELPAWIARAGWKGPGVSQSRWLVSGHSNGGQGSWYISTHQPDFILAAAPVSGYTSIENYVPFVMWSEADPLQSAVLQISRSNFRHEVLLENLRGIPVLQQHGSADDNVPPYHSRLMNSILSSVGDPSKYFELPGKGHWFDNTMVTEPLKEFYDRYLRAGTSVPSVPDNFSVLIPNSDDMESRHGIKVDQLESPDRLGRIDVTTNFGDGESIWHMRTSNIHRFHFLVGQEGSRRPSKFCLDDSRFESISDTASWTFKRSKDGTWTIDSDETWKGLDQRHGRQRGALDAIMRTTSPFQVVAHAEAPVDVAVQVTRNMLQYYGADSDILQASEYNHAIDAGGNVISLLVGREIPESILKAFPIYLEADSLTLRLSNTGRISKIALAPGLGALFLRPLREERLELVIWGIDEAGLRQAARLVPTLTGVGQADFIVLDNKSRWQGHAGTLALGFLDHDWNISRASYVP